MDNLTKKLRKECLRISTIGQDGNLQSIFSVLDIIWTLYDRVMHWSPDFAFDDNRDLFVLSKGQATLGLCVVLAQKGFLDWKELDSFGQLHSRISLQADRTKFQGGIEVSAGSLGHGLPMAVGMAMANKIKGLTSRIYVLTGDGEFNEGTMWEASLLAAHKRLNNLCVIVDNNHSVNKMIDMGNLSEKLMVFGFETYEVNGHSRKELEKVLKIQSREKPIAIIADTVRGYGCPTLMADNSWFHRAPNQEELKTMLIEVDNFEKTDD